MKIYILSTFLVGVSSIIEPRVANSMKTIFLSLYYESLCPDSAAFVLEQLQPAMQILHKQIILRMVPFGKSKVIDRKAGTFSCQHGPSECLGNKVQICALHYMLRRTDLEKLNYVACEMTTRAGSGGDLECVNKSNISTEDVTRCVNSQQGTELLLFAESQTRIVAPHVIPTITVNRVFNQNAQYHAMADLLGLLCSELQDSVFCGQHYNKIALKEIFA